jgi:PhoH-like ATPase
MSLKKMFILDSNVLLYDPDALFAFADGEVGIPIMVLEELDTFKGESTERGYNSRETIRHLDALRASGSLKDGVALSHGGILRILFLQPASCEPSPLPLNVIDNRILYVAYCEQARGYDVHFVTKDLNARVKAEVIGLKAENYTIESVPRDVVFKGWVKVPVPSGQLKHGVPEGLLEFAQDYPFAINEFALVESRNNPFNYEVFRYVGRDKFIPVQTPKITWPLEPRNPQQLMALDLLFDNSVQFISLIGPAGTGKTFLILLAALHKTLVEQEFEKILITRPVVPLGPDIGYLPGDIQEKLHSWMQPIYDNMDFISHAVNAASQMALYKEEGLPSRVKKQRIKQPRAAQVPGIQELVDEGRISMEAITYMRGRSIPYQFIFIDEVQNLTPHEVKTLISRVGEGSKIILAGDPDQIDSPYLDFTSNGLVVASSKFRGQSLFGTVYLESSERSELSKLAGQLL